MLCCKTEKRERLSAAWRKLDHSIVMGSAFTQGSKNRVFAGALKMREMKMRDMKMWHQTARMENARHENARHDNGGNDNAGKVNLAC